MGKIENQNEKPFTEANVCNRDLVIQMLKYEDSIILGNEGEQIYRNPLFKPRVSLTPEYAIHRLVLSHFGFDTTDTSVENYRKIFVHYYNSPTNYDKEVLSSVAYMRENKCVYYTKPIVNVGDIIPDVMLYNLDGNTTTTLYATLANDFDYAFVAGYSSS